MEMDILFSEREIIDKVTELANLIDEDFNGEEVVLVGVLKGSFVFIADIIRKLNIKTKVDFISVSSYGNETTSSGVVRLIKDLDHDIEGKNVIIIEDIVDSGLTLKYLEDLLKRRNPKTIKICTLLNKECRRQVDIKVDYSGFTIDDYFVVGYGIDCAEDYRYLPYIGHVKKL